MHICLTYDGGKDLFKVFVDGVKTDVYCGEKNCALCYFPQRMNLTFRGLCGSETKKMEGYFFHTLCFLKGFVKLKPHWRGLRKYHVYF
jgi:hypothetical protein